MRGVVIILFILVFSQGIFAQRPITPEVIEQFKAKHPGVDVEALLRFSERQGRQWKKKHQEAIIRAKQLGLHVEMHTPDGRLISLQYFENGVPVYYMCFDLNSRRRVSSRNHNQPHSEGED